MNDNNESYLHNPDSRTGVYPPMDYEGLWIEHWPDGQLKFRGHFDRRNKRIGQHISFWENGVLQELSYWVEGYACGTVSWFREDGTKELERDFGEQGGKTRSWIERSFSISGRIYNVEVWTKGKCVAEWVDPETQKLFDEISLDDIVASAVREVYPDDTSRNEG